MHIDPDPLEYMLVDIPDQICQIMKRKHITRTMLAQRLNISQGAITKMLNGSNYTLKTLLALAKALDVELTVQYHAH